MPLTLLVVSSETPDQQRSRRETTGAASHETFADTLRGLAPDCAVDHASCVGGDDPPRGLATYDGILFPGSPIQMHEDTPETRAAARFMGRAFEAGCRMFGSCAGLQIAAVAAGGVVGLRSGAMEVAVARGISATEAGRGHPLLTGRPCVWDAPAMHTTVVETMPDGGTVLARAEGTPVEAAAIRHGPGVFWGVQYHPEIGPGEIALTLKGRAASLVEQGMAADEAAVNRYADALRALDDDPSRRDLAWQLGLGPEMTDPQRRTREVANALAWFRSP